MTEDYEIDALEYLLDQMDAGRRARFEEVLAQDPAARQTLKACADSLAHFASEAAPAEPLTPADQRAALNQILAATRPEPVAPRAPARVIPWSRYAWPIAAALLLALNFVQLRQYAPGMVLRREESGAEIGAQETVRARPSDSSPAQRPAAAGATALSVDSTGREPASSSPGRAAAATAKTSEVQLAQLRDQYVELQRSNAALRAEYDAMVRHLAHRAVVERNVSRLATMELVDAASYARGERKGLQELARSLLTEPGVVVAELASDTPETPTVDAGTGATIAPGLPPETGAIAPTTATKTAYAWSVYDDQEHRGYLNLYNLPAPARDQALQLWVKPIGSEGYQRVGEIPPQLQGGNGSLYYTLPNGTPTPAEVMITQEPRNTVGAIPGGTVVLRGP